MKSKEVSQEDKQPEQRPDSQRILSGSNLRLDKFNVSLVDVKDDDQLHADAEDIARAFREQYGEHYFDVYLDADRVAGLIRTDDTYTFVARMDDGTFVGTGSLMTKGKCAELGRVVVPEGFRGPMRFKGRRVYDNLIIDRMQLARELEMDLLHTAAVTWTADSQAGLAKKSFTPVALQRGKYLPITPEEMGIGRESTLLMLYRGSEFGVTRPEIYLPQRLEAMVQQTLEELYEPRVIPNLRKHTTLKRKLITGTESHIGRMKVYKYGLDAQENKHVCFAAYPFSDTRAPGDFVHASKVPDHVLETVQEHDLQYAEVAVAVNNASGRIAIDALQDYGFDIAGFIPGWLRSGQTHDAVLMTYTAGNKDLSRIQTTVKTDWVKAQYLELNQ